MCEGRDDCDKIANEGDGMMALVIVVAMLAMAFVGMKATTPVELPQRDVREVPEECQGHEPR